MKAAVSVAVFDFIFSPAELRRQTVILLTFLSASLLSGVAGFFSALLLWTRNGQTLRSNKKTE